MVVQSLFKKDKIGYYGINSLIEEYIADCPNVSKVQKPFIDSN